MFRLIVSFFRPALDFASAMGGAVAGTSDIIEALKLSKPDYYMPSGTPSADQIFMQALSAISQATNRNTGMVDPVLLQSYSKMLGIDLSGLVSAGAQAGDQYKQLASRTGQFGDATAGMGAEIQKQAFDPQNALHDFTRQGVIDTSRAADSSRGLAMSPYSSGNESTASRNFELDWQNRQLGREMAGGAAANQMYGASTGYGSYQPEATMAGAQAPIAGQMAAYGAPMAFSNQFLGAENNMLAQQYGVGGMALPYFEYGVGAGSNLFNQRLGRDQVQAGLLHEGFVGGSGVGIPGQPSGVGNPMSWVGMGGMGGMGG